MHDTRHKRTSGWCAALVFLGQLATRGSRYSAVTEEFPESLPMDAYVYVHVTLARALSVSIGNYMTTNTYTCTYIYAYTYTYTYTFTYIHMYIPTHKHIPYIYKCLCTQIDDMYECAV